jgi:hypothetical protein
LAAVRARYDRAALEYDPFRKHFPTTKAAVACLSDVPALVAEVERLTALLAPLVAVMPDTDTGACAYCNDTDAPEGRHAADCPWWSARTGAART